MIYLPSILFVDIVNEGKVYEILKNEPSLFACLIVEPRKDIKKRVVDKIRKLGEYKVADFIENKA